MNIKAMLREFEKRMALQGECACGGTMAPHPWRRLVWICDRSHWWNRKRHAYIVVTRESVEVRRVQ